MHILCVNVWLYSYEVSGSTLNLFVQQFHIQKKVWKCCMHNKCMELYGNLSTLLCSTRFYHNKLHWFAKCLNLSTCWFNYIGSIYGALTMPIISLFHFPSPNWHFWKGKKETTITNKEKFYVHCLERQNFMPYYHSIELTEVLHGMCKDIYCQLQHIITEVLDCK